MGLGSTIKKVREFKNLTQEYVANEIGISRRHYINVENGYVNLKDSMLEKIAKVLDVNVLEIKSFNHRQFFSGYNEPSEHHVISELLTQNSELKEINLSLQFQVTHLQKIIELQERLLAKGKK